MSIEFDQISDQQILVAKKADLVGTLNLVAIKVIGVTPPYRAWGEDRGIKVIT